MNFKLICKILVIRKGRGFPKMFSLLRAFIFSVNYTDKMD